MTGSLEGPWGPIPIVDSIQARKDRMGTLMVRLGLGRMGYTVIPGLYGIGSPDSSSPVFVTANYKLSFDHLRRNLAGVNGWILVLNTKGINVWCAAGKGTFGTAELMKRIYECKLPDLLEHRRLIVPQLGAPGVSAFKVKKETGFSVDFGPVMAEDLPAYLNAGGKATREMRLKHFPLEERLVLVPVELVNVLKIFVFIAPVLFLFGGLADPSHYLDAALDQGVGLFILFLYGIAGGAIITPALLPVLPGRAFALKGGVAGILLAVFVALATNFPVSEKLHLYDLAADVFIITAVSSYLGMQFTGASTYTSLSGVKKEMLFSIPVQIFLLTAGLLSWYLANTT